MLGGAEVGGVEGEGMECDEGRMRKEGGGGGGWRGGVLEGLEQMEAGGERGKGERGAYRGEKHGERLW